MQGASKDISCTVQYTMLLLEAEWAVDALVHERMFQTILLVSQDAMTQMT